jgi:hypothetical protein
MATPDSAKWMRRMHPNRLGYRLLSDRNPFMLNVPVLAEKIRQDRRPLGGDNLFRSLEGIFSDQVYRGLNAWRDLRDSTTERLFMDIYGQPVLQALVGLGGDAHVHRRRPGAEPEHRRFIERRRAEVRDQIEKGGSHEAVMRSVIHVMGGAPATDERNFNRLRASRAELEPEIQLADFKHLMREQFFILKLDREAALEAIPTLLKGQTAEQIDDYLAHIEHVLAASGELSSHAADRFAHIQTLFHRAIDRAPLLELEARADAEAELVTEAQAESVARQEAEALNEGLSPEQAAPEASAPKEAAPEETTPKESAPEAVAPEQLTPETPAAGSASPAPVTATVAKRRKPTEPKTGKTTRQPASRKAKSPKED